MVDNLIAAGEAIASYSTVTVGEVAEELFRVDVLLAHVTVTVALV